MNVDRGANAKNSCESGNNTRTSFHVHIYSATLRVTAALRAKSKATLAIGGREIAVIKTVSSRNGKSPPYRTIGGHMWER